MRNSQLEAKLEKKFSYTIKQHIIKADMVNRRFNNSEEENNSMKKNILIMKVTLSN